MTGDTVVSECAADPDDGSDDAGQEALRPPAAADPLYHGVMLGMALAIIVLAAVLRVGGEEHVVVPLLGQPLPAVCSLKRLSGLDCPGCGLTRSLISLAHGNVAQAWHFNPAGLAVAVVVVIQIPYRLWQLGRWKRGLPELRWRGLTNGVILLLAVALFAQWLARIIASFID